MSKQEEVYYELKKISNLFARRVIKGGKPKAMETKFSRSQAMMLAYIIERQGREKVYQKDIEKFFSIRRSTATETLKKLEEENFIRRVQSKADRRLKEIEPTNKTLNLGLDLRRSMQDLSELLFENIPEDELEAFKSTLKKMRHNLEEN